MAKLRHAVRESLKQNGAKPGELILVAVSGGSDSMALAGVTNLEASKLGLRLGAVIVEHGLQAETEQVANDTAKFLVDLGLEPVHVVSIQVGGEGGPEAAARSARYEAIDQVASKEDARFVLLGHTKNDQAESVLLGLARGSGGRSLTGMAELTGRYLRPFLDVLREETEAACEDLGFKYWSDPQNIDPKFSRVRARLNVLPVLESELGPGIVDALARTADQLREDSDQLDSDAEHLYHRHAKVGATSIQFPIAELEKIGVAHRNRIFRIAAEVLGGTLHRNHVQEIDRLITKWHGQKALAVPSVRVERTGENIVFKSTKTLKPGAC